MSSAIFIAGARGSAADLCSGFCAELDLAGLSGHAGLLGTGHGAGQRQVLLVAHAASVAQGAGTPGASAPLGGLPCPAVAASQAAAARCAAYKATQPMSGRGCRLCAAVIYWQLSVKGSC